MLILIFIIYIISLINCLNIEKQLMVEKLGNSFGEKPFVSSGDNEFLMSSTYQMKNLLEKELQFVQELKSYAKVSR